MGIVRDSEFSVAKFATLRAETAAFTHHSREAVCVTYESLRCSLELMHHIRHTVSHTKALLSEADRRLSDWHRSFYLWEAIARSGER